MNPTTVTTADSAAAYIAERPFLAPALPDGLDAADAERIAQAIEDSRAPSTRRNYRACWQRWESWCEGRGVQALPGAPEHVAAYLAERAELGLAHGTIALDRAAIASAHREAGELDPTQHNGVRRVLAGLRRQRPGPPEHVDPLMGEDLERVLARLPATRAGRRDAALILLMRDGLLRRSEASALTWRDLHAGADGSGRLMIRRSKDDQEGEGALLYVSARTVDALASHSAPHLDPDAPMFVVMRGSHAGRPMSGQSIADAITRACERAGLVGRYSGHSLRRGSAQALAEAGESTAAIADAGRWKSLDSPARYVAGVEAGRGAAARVFGGRTSRLPHR